MTEEELLKRLNDIEWDDFEVKEATGGIPKSMWETVSALYPLVKVNSRQTEPAGGENNGENGENNGEKKLIEQIKLNPNVTQPQLSEILGFSLRKVNRIISNLRKSGRIVRIGKTKGGYWKVKS